MILSFIIPVYQVEKYIAKTIDSIFASNLKEDQFEVIFINDGTKDKSMDIVYRYAESHTNISIVNQTNQGLSAARNAGLKISKGENVWFVDSDDYIETKNIQAIFDILNKNQCEVYLFKMKHVDECGNSVPGWSLWNTDSVISGQDLILNGLPYTPIQQFIFKRKFLYQNHLFFKNGIYHEDQEFAPRVLMLPCVVYVSTLFSYNYLRRNSGSIMTNPSLLLKRKKDLLEMFDYYINMYKNTDVEGKKTVIKKILYDIIKGLFIGLNKDNYKQFEVLYKKHYTLFKKIVLSSISFRSRFLLLLRQLVFCLSPKLLIYIEKTL